jgi:ribosome-binding ATPase
MKTGLIGFPGSGVTTVFSLFCRREYDQLANSGKSEVHLGETKVPDGRVEKLAEIFHSRKTVHATIEFADIPFEKHISETLAPATITHIRNMDAVVVVLRAFSNPAVPHIAGAIDPVRDLHTILQDVLLTDLIQVEKRLERIEKEGRIKSREGQVFLDLKQGLEQSVPVRDMQLGVDIRKELSGFRLLSEKPWLVIVNTDPGEDLSEGLLDALREHSLPGMPIAAQFELELEAFPENERMEFLRDIRMPEGGRNRFIDLVFSRLDLISFFTYGEDESRAWPLRRGSTALEAAGKIHSDFARGFIRAEVFHFDELMEHGGNLSAIKKSGKMRIEGKKYSIQDGDIVTILFNI